MLINYEKKTSNTIKNHYIYQNRYLAIKFASSRS